MELSRGREAIFPETPRVANGDSVYNQDASLRWPDSREIAEAMLMENYDARLRARLDGPNVTHVSRVGEIPAEADAARQFVLWYKLKPGDRATELASHFGLWNDAIAQGAHHGVHDISWKGTRVLLVNTLEQEHRLLPYKPAALNALPADHAAASKAAPTSQCTVQQCGWTMIAGDSNSRRVVDSWLQGMMAGRGDLARRAQRTGAFSSPRCSERWADNEWVMTDGHGGCHILTQRFLTSQLGVARLAADMTDSAYCGTRLLDPLRADQRRPAQPSLIWFGHGMWELPNNGNSTGNLDCNGRFANVVAALRRLQASNQTQVVWQTNHLIKKHPTVTNDYLEWEIQCQRQIAEAQGIPIFDLPKFMEKQASQLDDDGYHLHLSLVYELAKALDGVAHQPAEDGVPAKVLQAQLEQAYASE